LYVINFNEHFKHKEYRANTQSFTEKSLCTL
jgi:hypothetical protein